MALGACQAALGQHEEAIADARKAVAMRPLSEDAESGPPLLADLAQVYLWAGEDKLALTQLLALENTPCALNYGFLRNVPNLACPARQSRVLAIAFAAQTNPRCQQTAMSW